ncbi:MAG: DUF2235 domain-containing protein [Hyphomicrobiaceae bacterium]
MGQTAQQEVTEDLAQLGIKRGSIIWPILALLVASLMLAVYFQKPDHSPVNDLFKAACKGVGLLAQPDTKISPIAQDCFAASPPGLTEAVQDARIEEAAKTALVNFRSLGIVEKWDVISELMKVDGNKARSDSNKKEMRQKAEFGWDLFVETAQVYTRELIGKFGGTISELARSAWTVGLVSLIPGLAGMIYRRNFWGWFMPPFVILFAIVSGIIGQQSDEGELFIFIVLQILIILLALRLQRYTRKTGVLPPSIHNWLLAIVLVLVAVAGWFEYGKAFWDLFSGWYKWQFILIGLPVLYSLLRRSDVWSSIKPKNIVVCLDGTTNTPDQFESGRLAQTNVFKLFKMLKSDERKPGGLPERAFNASLSKRYSDKQVGLYYSGVGNKFEYDPIVQTLGGVTGLGAAGVVDKAYLDIIRVYRPGDRIFIFGFSRGAAIARLLSRALDQRGAPRTIWTWRLLGRHWTLWQSKRAHHAKVPVKVLGCFDTVGAFGIGKNIAGIDFQKLDLFKDLTVPDNVEQAYHMVAMDETREEFSPTLMDPDPINPARIVEVWFAGDHANIGGGWGTTKLSDLTFDFALRKVSSGYAHTPGATPGDERWGIYLNAANERVIAPERVAETGAYPLHPDALGQLRLWKSAVYIYKPREMPNHAVISESVFERMTNAAPLYAPASLFNLHEALHEKRTRIDAAVKSLKDTQSVSEQEHDAILTFKERLQLIRWPQYAAGLKAMGAPPPDETLNNTPAEIVESAVEPPQS